MTNLFYDTLSSSCLKANWKRIAFVLLRNSLASAEGVSPGMQSSRLLIGISIIMTSAVIGVMKAAGPSLQKQSR